MILESVENGPLLWPIVEENRVTRPKKYSELSATEAIQADCDVKATNIILQGLPPEVYALRECKLYDEFDKFAYKKGESLRDFYLRFSLLLNYMNIYNMKLKQFQVNTKFLNTLPPEWSKFMTDVKLVRDLHMTNVDQLHAYLGQHEYHANEVHLMHERTSDLLALVANHQMNKSPYQPHQQSYQQHQFQPPVSSFQSSQYGSPYHSSKYASQVQSSKPLSITYPSNDFQSSVNHNVYNPSSSISQMEYAPAVHQQSDFSQPESGLVVPVFQKGDDPIDVINHMMSFLTAVVTSRKPILIESNTSKPVVTFVYSRKSKAAKKTVPVSKSKINKSLVVQIILWYLDSGCSKHMTGDRSQLINFVHKFLGTVKSGNDHVAKIMGYGDYKIGNVTILRVYFMEGLGHNLFSMGQFCDSDLEVAFRQHTCFIRNLDGVNLLTGSRGNNLYTLSLKDMMASSPICLLSKASKTKFWLWHRRLSHLNFGAINHLARQGLVRGLPKLKFEKDHLCSACAMGKKSVNGKKYILVIIDDYSRFTWVNCLRSKDEALNFIIKFLKMIQVRLKVGISHETSVARSPQQNGVIERHNCTLIEAARTIENLRKLQPKADIGIFIGYAPTKKAFRIYNRLDTLMVEKSKPNEDKEGKAVDPSHYRGMIGTLLYLTASRPDLQFAICICARTMDTTIDQQVAMDEALVPHARKLRIGRRNFSLLSDISSKESTLQLVYDVLRLTPFFKTFLVTANVPKIYIQEFWATATVHHHSIRFKMDNKKHIVNLESFREMLHICPRLPGQSFVEPPFEEEILAFLYSDTTVTPPAATAGPRLSTSAKGKQPATTSKAKSLSALLEMKELVLYQGFPMYLLMSLRKKSLGIPLMKKAMMKEMMVMMEDAGNDEDDQEEGSDDEQAFDEEEFIRLSLSTHAEEETRDKESFDPVPKTPENIDDEGNGRGVQMADVYTTQEFEDTHVTLTLVNPDGQQQSSSVSSQFVTSMLNPTPDAGMGSIFKTTSQMDVQTPTSVAPLPIYIDQKMNEAVKVDVQLQSDRLHDEAQKENDEFLKTIDENMQKIIKEQVKEQVKVQVSKILPKIEQTVNEQLEAEVLTRSSNSSKTSYVVAADLLEMELKKILIEKIEGNKSIRRSNEQRNLYKALVEAYESDKIILDRYGDTVTLKRRRNDDADKDEEPFVGSDRGSKRRREGKEPKSASAPREKATRSAGKSTQGSKSRQTSVSESATAEESMQTTFEMEEPSHPEFKTGADDQPVVEPSQHPEWFSQQKKPPTLDRDWNKTFPATHESIQQWISELEKQSDSRFSFNELMDTPPHPHNLLKPLPLIPNNRGRHVIPFDHFIHNDLEYLCEGASSRNYTTSVTKTKAADYHFRTF
nr:hypothetical protein [Tanacetum cinerariifolium]